MLRTTFFKVWPIFVWILITCALCAGIFLLLSDLFKLSFLHAPVSAAPLLLIGAGYLSFQLLAKVGLLDFLKALIVSAAFLLWGVDQLLPTGWIATTLGDIVIVLYVLDLGWVMSDRLKAARTLQKLPEKKAEETYDERAD